MENYQMNKKAEIFSDDYVSSCDFYIVRLELNQRLESPDEVDDENF